MSSKPIPHPPFGESQRRPKPGTEILHVKATAETRERLLELSRAAAADYFGTTAKVIMRNAKVHLSAATGKYVMESWWRTEAQR